MGGKDVHRKAFGRADSFPPIASVYRMFNPSGMPNGHQAHVHPTTVEICCVLHGSVEWWLEETTHALKTNDVFVALPNQAHGSLDATLQPCEYYAIHLDPLTLPDIFRHSVQDPEFGGVYREQPEVGNIIQTIFREHESPDSMSQDLCHGLTCGLVAHLARKHSSGRERQTSEFLRAAQNQLLNSSPEAPTVSEAATALGVSTVWLNRQFRKELGVSPSEWVRKRKIAQAKKLLAVQNCGVTEAAIELGYSSSQYFATAFRRETGLSPSAYRAYHLKPSPQKILLAPI